MSKFISVIVPYIIVGLVFIMNFVSLLYKEIVMSVILGIMIGIWFLSTTKTEGTKPILIILWITFILLIAGDIVTYLYFKEILPSLILCSVLQLFAIYLISKNKPRLNMTYKYSFKNKRKRYF